MVIRASRKPSDHPTIANVFGSAVRDREINCGNPRVRRPSDHRERLWDRAGEIAAGLRAADSCRCLARLAYGQYQSSTAGLFANAMHS